MEGKDSSKNFFKYLYFQIVYEKRLITINIH